MRGLDKLLSFPYHIQYQHSEGGIEMKIRNLVNGYEYQAKLRKCHSGASYGQAILVDEGTGDAIDRFSFACSEIVQATERELRALLQAGYLSEPDLHRLLQRGE